MKKVFIPIFCIMYLRSRILCLQIIIPHDFNDKRLVALLPEKFRSITKIIYSDDQIDRLCNDLYNDSVPRLKDSQAKRWKDSMKTKIHTGLTTNRFIAYFIGKIYSKRPRKPRAF